MVHFLNTWNPLYLPGTSDVAEVVWPRTLLPAITMLWDLLCLELEMRILQNWISPCEQNSNVTGLNEN